MRVREARIAASVSHPGICAVFALDDLEGDVDAVLRQLDDLGLDGRREAAVAVIDLQQALHVGLDAAAGEHHARTQLDFRR